MILPEKSKDFPDCFYRVVAKAMVVKDGKVMLVKESPNLSGQWELPGGGIDFGEDPIQALRREIEEEMNLKIKSVNPRPIYVWPWRMENLRGMDWFYSFVIAYRVELESFDFTPNDACTEIKFFSAEDLKTADLHKQTNGLKVHFKPEDFK